VTTDDPTDPRLRRGPDTEPSQMAPAYLVLPEEQRAKGFVRPFRTTYQHTLGCGGRTSMSRALAETYARDPKFYGSTWCVGCSMHRPVDEFNWDGTDERVGS
jgi:hypothetical protein